MITVTLTRELTLTPQQWAALVGSNDPAGVAGLLWQHHPKAAHDAVLADGTTEDLWHVYVHPEPHPDDLD